MKLTDNEIIKALECCSSNATGNEYCKDCPYNIYEYCGEESAKDTLDLINRLKAEKETFETLANEYKDKVELLEIEKSAMQHRIDKQQAEIERLNELLERENEKYVIAMTALKEANEEKAKLSKAIEESNEYFSEGDFVKGLAIVIGLSNTFTKLPHSSLCETETYEGVTDTNVGHN